MPIGWFFGGSYLLFEQAVEAYQRCKQIQVESDDYQRDAITAIILNAAALEAFINEILAQRIVLRNALPAFLHELADTWDDEDTGIRNKYRLVALCLGASIKKGSEPYESFDYLIRLRNMIMHFKSEYEIYQNNEGESIYVYPKRFFSQLENMGLLISSKSGQTPWYQQIQTTSMAKWACETATSISQVIVDRFIDTISKNIDADTEDLRKVYTPFVFTP